MALVRYLVQQRNGCVVLHRWGPEHDEYALTQLVFTTVEAAVKSLIEDGCQPTGSATLLLRYVPSSFREA
jgi:hypothetical protein